VDGSYRITITPPEQRVSVAVTLTRDGQPPFTASLLGERREPASIARASIASATTSLRVTTLIRWQGIRLFLRGLKVQPRPVHVRQEAV
ncbi:MAG: DUF1365 family protein, partial [Frankiaceae bacterium]|nr:DUF1365 family protein [Frankiaceae bacterium]